MWKLRVALDRWRIKWDPVFCVLAAVHWLIPWPRCYGSKTLIKVEPPRLPSDLQNKSTELPAGTLLAQWLRDHTEGPSCSLPHEDALPAAGRRSQNGGVPTCKARQHHTAWTLGPLQKVLQLNGGGVRVNKTQERNLAHCTSNPVRFLYC